LEPVAVDDFGLPIFFDGGKALFQVDGFVLYGVLLWVGWFLMRFVVLVSLQAAVSGRGCSGSVVGFDVSLRLTALSLTLSHGERGWVAAALLFAA